MKGCLWFFGSPFKLEIWIRIPLFTFSKLCTSFGRTILVCTNIDIFTCSIATMSRSQDILWRDKRSSTDNPKPKKAKTGNNRCYKNLGINSKTIRNEGKKCYHISKQVLTKPRIIPYFGFISINYTSPTFTIVHIFNRLQ